jgi:hypothetical protein
MESTEVLAIVTFFPAPSLCRLSPASTVLCAPPTSAEAQDHSALVEADTLCPGGSLMFPAIPSQRALESQDLHDTPGAFPS